MLRKFRAYDEKRLAIWETALSEIYADLEASLVKNNSFTKQQVEQLEITALGLERKIAKAQRFLSAYAQDPKSLTLQLSEQITNLLKKYRDDYYVEDDIYQFILPLDTTIKNIIEFEPKEANLTDNVIWRERYALLCGFLWYLIPYENNFSFNDVLYLLFQEIHLTNYEKITNTANNLNCKAKFLAFKANHPALFEVSKDQLNQQRIKDYQQTLSNLRMLCEQDKASHLSQPGLLLASAVEAEVGKNPKRKTKRLHFYESMLKTAKRTIEDPEKNCDQLIGYLPMAFKDSRTTNRVGGALLCLAGAALLTLSGLAIAGTLGLGLGLGFILPGIFFGCGLMIAGSYMATSSKVPTFKNPFGFFKQRNEHVYNAIHVFADAEKAASLAKP